MVKRGGSGIISRLQAAEWWIFTLTWILVSVQLFLWGFYSLTRSYAYTYFRTPSTYGVLYTEWFKVWDWWKTGSFAATLFVAPLAWTESMYFKVSWPKILMLIFLSTGVAWWLVVVVVDIVFMASNPNDPSVSTTNPARSFKVTGERDIHTQTRV
jgi:hypothetical protein